MAKLLSFLSWNVENFHADPTRVERVVDLIASKGPDVFGIYEVKGSAVFDAMVAKLPGYTFAITESAGVPEILVGVRAHLTAFITQRDELQSKVPTLRPGALATIHLDGVNYAFLFLHLKSFADPRDWGLRDDMFAHVASLKRTLDRQVPAGQRANFVALGDVNTMGMQAPYNDRNDLTSADELAFVDRRMSAPPTGMRRLVKTSDETWWSGKDGVAASSLDHVYASDHLRFRSFANGAEVEVVGWVNEATTAAKQTWIGSFSDHALLYGEIHD